MRANIVWIPAAAAALSWTLEASAQIDVNPPLPNVMLLVDTSGSMEYLADGSLPATCDPSNTSSDINRWATLVEVLTGTVENRTCYAQSRSSNGFKTEYALGGNDPYDASYFLPYHRIVSNGCVAGPGNLPAAVYDWPAGAIGFHPWNDTAGSCATPFSQGTDGLLDVYRDRARFGLMTFDSSPDPGTGLSGGAADYATGIGGLWSYFLGWQTGGTAAVGRPAGCTYDMDLEVGARNAAAPPWEGRMIAFGPHDAPTVTLQTINDQIQQAVLAMRPYGATPLDGMLTDARDFFRNDASLDPVNAGYDFGPRNDPFVVQGCRDQYAIILSDGEPNLDMRPHCEAATGVCPYPQRAYEIAADLYNGGSPSSSVPVFAVGFGLSSGTGFDCDTLSPPMDFQAGGACDGATGSLAACCTLARIAWEGGTNRAYFADNLSELRNALSQVLAQITSNSTSRTMPAFAAVGASQAGNSNAPAVAYEFTSSLDPRPGALWSGNLERNRWVCETVSGVLTPVLKPVEPSKGDDFTANVNDGKVARPRQFHSFVGTQSTLGGNPFIDSEGSIRPNLTADDGLGLYGGNAVSGGHTALATSMQSNPAAMGMYPMPAACSQPLLGAATESDCAYRVMNWELGGSNGGGMPQRGPEEFGAIYHATPAISGPPSAAIRDPAYEAFALANTTRPLMLYAVTTDGQLHAFKVASNDPADSSGVLGDQLQNNELWSFLPPHVLPNILGQYSSSQQILLDGTPVVEDVLFERTLNQAVSGSASWHTVLVAGGRGAGGFYYALDVTDPTQPEFLWQLSNTRAGGTVEPLFGNASGTPAVTTITYDDGTDVREIGVAILPGGQGTLGTGTCTRNNGSFAHIDAVPAPNTTNYQPRGSVRCWQDGAARSLTIVRVDTGEVLMNFRGVAADGPGALPSSRVKVVGFDSPITGEPVPFPARSGQVSDRIYVGDADGTLWRIDLSSSDPADWTAHIAWDAYSASGDLADEGQPVETRPVISLDELGNTVILFSTGDQENFFTPTAGMKTRIWSILEEPVAVGTVPFRNKENWLIQFADGKRVTGPIALFDEVAYFATFTPQTGLSSCADGFGSIWGVHFTQSTTSAQGPYPLARLPQDPNAVPIVFVDEQPQDPGTVVFGVSLTQEPACFETASVTDEYVGTYTQITTAVPPRFQLTFHTGNTGQPNTGSQTNTARIALPLPRNTSRIDSWASILE